MERKHTAADLKHAASGRWLDILDSAGLPDILDGRGRPCPKCGGRDRFASLPDVNGRGAVHCRGCFHGGSDPKPGDGIATIQWLFGCDFVEARKWLAVWLGIPQGEQRPMRITRVAHIDDVISVDVRLRNMARRCHRSMQPGWWDRICELLTLPAEPLKRLQVGWSESDRATTWPMVDETGDVIGIRLRSMRTGDKWSVAGGRAGLFVPVGIAEAPKRLFICEGPSDTAAMLSLGLDAIGRPSSSGAVKMTAGYVRRLHPAEVVIVADNDEHDAGINGARLLVDSLVMLCRVRLLIPPDGFNDARDWIVDDATAADIHAAADAAELYTLEITSGVRQ